MKLNFKIFILFKFCDNNINITNSNINNIKNLKINFNYYFNLFEKNFTY